jgi:hypothetical protein
VVDFQAICEVPNASSTFVSVGDDDYFVAAVDEFGGKLVDVGFDSAWRVSGCLGAHRVNIPG